jgi:hypothetical protein
MRIIISLFVAALAGWAQSFGFGDIRQWFGRGAKQVGVVVQWSRGDRPQAYAWGFRFDGTLTGDVVWDAVLRDPRLYAYQQGSGTGRVVYGIGYDFDRDRITGFRTGNDIDDAVANDPDDRWKVGWRRNGYWSLWGARGSRAEGFAFSQTGIGGVQVQDQTWILWAFAPSENGWSTSPPDQIVAAPLLADFGRAGAPAPVPEPATIVAMGLGVVAFAGRRLRIANA